MRVMKIIWRADADVIYKIFAPTQLIQMPIESLELREEMRSRKVAIDHTDRIIWIVSNDQIPANALYCCHMPRRYIACSSNQCEFRHSESSDVLLSSLHNVVS